MKLRANRDETGPERADGPAAGSAAVRCATVTTEEGFAGLEAAWRELFQNASYPSPFCTWEWVSEWWSHFGPTLPGAGLHVVCAHGAGGDLIGAAPFYELPSGAGMLHGRRLRLLGELKTGEGMTEEPTVLLRRSWEEEALAAILAHLEAPSLAHWNHFSLPFLGERAPRVPWPHPETRRAGGGPQTVRLPDSWEEFRHGLTRSMRGNLAYYPRQMEKRGYGWTVRRVSGPDGVEEATDLLTGLHALRAGGSRGRPHTNHIPTRTHASFLRSVLRRLAAEGGASVAVMEADGRPIAAQAFFEMSGRMTVYYSGYDPAWYDFSPLTVLLAEVIKDGIGRGIHTMNFLSGEAPWKARWGAREGVPLQRLTGRLSYSLKAVTAIYHRGRPLRRRLKQLVQLVTSRPLLGRVP